MMKMRCCAIACALLAGSAFAADWRETLTPPVPGRFPPLRPLTAKYVFGWGAVTAAEGTFQFSKTKEGRLQLSLRTKTTGVVRSLWRMDAEHLALAQAATLWPISVRQTEIYKSETETTKADYRREGVERLIETTPAGASRAKKKWFPCANVFDLHTALLFVRSQPLQDGDVYRLPVFPARSLYLTEIRVQGREKLTVAGREYAAIKCDVLLQGVNRDLVLEAHHKFTGASAWISDDADRLLLKIDSEIFVGSVWAELESVTFQKR